MADVVFLQDLAIVMIVAGVVTVIFHLLKQPVVLGYILAGLLIGPHTVPMLAKVVMGPDAGHIGLVHDEHSIHTLSHLGLVFLMFGLGLHFSLRKLMSVGATAFVAAILEIVVMVLIGYYLGRFFGWGAMESLFLGAILSISSTTIIAKALVDLGRAKERFAELIFGILIVEDILAIAMLAVLSTMAAKGSLDVGDVIGKLGYLSIFLASVLVLGLLFVPVILRQVSKFKSDEIMLVTVLAFCFGVSMLAVKMGYSVALGAFLIGAIMAEAREVGKIDSLIAPLRDTFSAVFFVAVGMMINPHTLREYSTAIILCTVAVVVGKIISCTVGAYAAGNDTKTSLRVGMGLAQIGEFSFIIAQLGLTLPLASDPNSPLHSLYPIAVLVSVVTTLFTPYLIRASDPVANLIEKRAPRPIVGFLELYTDWLASLNAGDGSTAQVRRLLRKWVLQIGLNLALVSGLLIAGSSVGAKAGNWIKWVPDEVGGAKTLIWLCAVLLALPLMIASFLKVRAMATIIVDMKRGSDGFEEDTTALRGVIANVILIGGWVIIVMWVMLLSSAILPPWPVFMALAGVILLIATLMWNRFVGVYKKAQMSIRETLSQPIVHHHHHEPEEPKPIPPLLHEAVLQTVTLLETSAANGKLIRELELRTKTGASIVGIERENESLVNPGPDEELKFGDKVLILGTAEHLQKAGEFLINPPAVEEVKKPKRRFRKKSTTTRKKSTTTRTQKTAA